MQDVTYIPVNESMVLLSFGPGIDRRIHERLMHAKQLIEQHPFIGLIETVPAYNSLAVYYDPAVIKATNSTISSTVIDQLKIIIQNQSTTVDANEESAVITIPVCYEEDFGIDLQELSSSLQLSIDDIIQLHTNKTYHVFMIGFTPGFPYMGTVDERLVTNRKTKPRLTVPPGAVAIAGNQTGIYPFATPGGWNIVGRTPMQLFDRNKANPFFLRAGDAVQFNAITKDEFENYTALNTAGEHEKPNSSNRSTKAADEKNKIIQLEQCGFLTTLQDTGRKGYLQFGVSKSGAMDIHAAQLANALVGNELDEVVLEITQSPHRFHFLQDAVIAFTGAGLQPQNGSKSLQLAQPVFVAKGTVIECKQPIPGFRLYMAVAGGFAADEFLQSCSTDLLVQKGGYEGRSLKKNDVLNRRNSITTIQKKLMKLLQAGATIELSTTLPNYTTRHIRVVPGVEWNELKEASKHAFTNSCFTVSAQSSRMGYRLSGELLATSTACEIISSPVTQGTIQLTPSGEMIVLMADAQTVGGYPRIAQVCAADLSILAQKKPGDAIQFQIVSLQEAEELQIANLEELKRVKDILESMLT